MGFDLGGLRPRVLSYIPDKQPSRASAVAHGNVSPIGFLKGKMGFPPVGLEQPLIMVYLQAYEWNNAMLNATGVTISAS